MKKIDTSIILNHIKNPNIKSFLIDAFDNLNNANISINFYNSKSIKMEDGRSCSGWFCDIEKDISCIFLKRKKHLAHWLGIFIHEYSHFLQWKSNDQVFFRTINGTDPNVIMSSFLIDEQYQTEVYSEPEILEACEAVLELEYDAEHTTVELIKMYNLEDVISSKEYIKSAIAYFIFVYNSYKRKHWHNSNIESDYVSYVEFLSLLPDELSKEVISHNFLSKWEIILEKIYLEYEHAHKKEKTHVTHE